MTKDIELIAGPIGDKKSYAAGENLFNSGSGFRICYKVQARG